MRLPGIHVFRIEDTSMQPALRPGDRILVSCWPPATPGDMIAFRDPEAPSSVLVKRLQSVDGHGNAVVGGDNLNVSRDSRHFGPVPRRLVLGRVFFRYLPSERRGLV